jgi:hypothetical protein
VLIITSCLVSPAPLMSEAQATVHHQPALRSRHHGIRENKQAGAAAHFNVETPDDDRSGIFLLCCPFGEVASEHPGQCAS